MSYTDLICVHCGSKQKIFVGPAAESVGCSACAKAIPIKRLIELAIIEVEREKANEKAALETAKEVEEDAKAKKEVLAKGKPRR